MPALIAGAIAAVAGGASSIIGGQSASHAAEQAASVQAQQQQRALQFTQGVYDQGNANLSPWIGAGQSALGSLLSMYGLPGGTSGANAQGAFSAFQNTPFYQFPLQQSQLALNRQLASAGLSGSGAALRDGTALGAGYASQGLGQYLAGLGGIAGGGQNAGQSLLSFGNQNAQTQGGLYGGIGQSLAGGIGGSQAALSKGITGAISPFLSPNSGLQQGISSFINGGGTGSNYSPGLFGAGTGQNAGNNGLWYQGIGALNGGGVDPNIPNVWQ